VIKTLYPGVTPNEATKVVVPHGAGSDENSQRVRFGAPQCRNGMVRRGDQRKHRDQYPHRAVSLHTQCRPKSGCPSAPRSPRSGSPRCPVRRVRAGR
jgi:hypothetical protein